MNARDPRLTLAVGGVAASGLEGVVTAARYVAPTTMQAVVAVTALKREPAAAAEQLDQLLYGERFEVLDWCDGWAFGQATRDGYVGWVALEALAPVRAPATHWVSALRTWVFPEASIKVPPVLMLSRNALVRVEAIEGRFARLADGGFAPAQHLRPLGDWLDDPAALATHYLGAPYLWGGRDSLGIDCSGVVQQAHAACGLALPRDSDQQATLGASCGCKRSDARRPGVLARPRGDHAGRHEPAARQRFPHGRSGRTAGRSGRPHRSFGRGRALGLQAAGAWLTRRRCGTRSSR